MRNSRWIKLAASTVLLIVAATSPLLSVAEPAIAQDQSVNAAADLSPLYRDGGEGAPIAGPHGTVTFRQLAGDRTQATLILMGMEPGQYYSWHIHSGSCGGPVLYALSGVRADTGGTAQATDELPARVDFGVWYVDAHIAGSGPSGITLCGSVNPAIVDPLPPGASPAGMPRTGLGTERGEAASWPLIAALATLILFLGAAVRRFNRSNRV